MTLHNKYSRLVALATLSAILGLSLLLEGCTDQCTDTRTYTYFEPVYTPLSVIRSSVAQKLPQPLAAVGKIYFKDGFLFVNDPGKGIHVIDNTNPSNPVKKSFINIPGSYDLAIRNNILYADSYVDLVVLDISNINSVKEVYRLENIFQNYSSLGFFADEVRGVVTDWAEVSEVSIEKSECEGQMEPWGGMMYKEGIAVADASLFSVQSAVSPGNSTGIGGSMARFTISADHLYLLDAGSMYAVDIGIEQQPEKKSGQHVAWDIETIFPYEDKLLIGARSGMHIYGLSAPENPEWISTYAHIRSCDPVVADGDYAYVTLRSGTECEGFSNQLEVLDISTISSPSLLKVYPMHNPHGLGVDGDALFICDGNEGLKIYNAEDKKDIDNNLIRHYKNIHAFDVIPFNGVLMLIGEDGIFQYDYSDLSNITLLSHLQLEPQD